MVEVFKTNIQCKEQEEELTGFLSREFPAYKITIDLMDCDKILRVENNEKVMEVEAIIKLVKSMKVEIDILLDV